MKTKNTFINLSTIKLIQSNLLNLVKRITSLTSSWYKEEQNVLTRIQEKKLFYERFSHFANATGQQKLRWNLYLIGIVVMVGIDYATLFRFFEWLGLKVSPAMSTIVQNLGFLVFLTIELVFGAVLQTVLKQRRIKNRSSLLMIIYWALMAILICFPMGIVLGEYFLTTSKSVELPIQTITLVGLSFLVHSIIFLAMGTVITGLEYMFIYMRKHRKYTKTNFEDHLTDITEELKEEYINYEDSKIKLKALDKDQNVIAPQLGKLENKLRKKLDKRRLLEYDVS